MIEKYAVVKSDKLHERKAFTNNSREGNQLHKGGVKNKNGLVIVLSGIKYRDSKSSDNIEKYACKRVPITYVFCNPSSNSLSTVHNV